MRIPQPDIISTKYYTLFLANRDMEKRLGASEKSPKYYVPQKNVSWSLMQRGNMLTL